MKRANHLFEKIIDPDNLRLAFWKASKGKRYSKEVLRYAENLKKNLAELRKELIAGKVSETKKINSTLIGFNETHSHIENIALLLVKLRVKRAHRRSIFFMK
jgi:hypothetical protein